MLGDAFLTDDQLTVCGILLGVFIFFLWGKYRYDLVAFGALVAAVLAGVVPGDEAFLGFGHPAIITVALVLMLSRGLVESGAIDVLTARVVPDTSNPVVLIGALALVAAILSSFMNNVGALALLMPVAIHGANRAGLSPALVLMPLAFASMLGGMTTLVGTPPNIIVSSIRGTETGAPFQMFDFTMVGLPIAVLGLIYIVVLGWRFIPSARKGRTPSEELVELKPYVTEVRVSADSPLLGQFMSSVTDSFAAQDAAILGLIRGEEEFAYPGMTQRLMEDDILVIQAETDALEALVTDQRLHLVGDEAIPRGSVSSDRVALIEAVVMPNARIGNLTPRELGLRERYKLNLLAVSREGRHTGKRLNHHRFHTGDVLLLQGDADQIYEAVQHIGCLPLANRNVRVGRPRRALIAALLFIAAIGLAVAQVMPITISFGLALVGMIMTRIIGPSQAYSSIDVPVIILLGAMIPVGQAIQTTGLADLVGAAVADLTSGQPPWVALALVMVATMTLSDVINNAATAVVMAPIAAAVAMQMGAAPDAFYMAVAIGASCAFLTPIGHQNNTLVMGPGGYRFGDYWRMGLALELLVVAIAVPALMIAWPL